MPDRMSDRMRDKKSPMECQIVTDRLPRECQIESEIKSHQWNATQNVRERIADRMSEIECHI